MSYQKIKDAEGMIGIYKELMELQSKIDELQQYLDLLNKYTGAQETIDRTKNDLEKLRVEKESLLKKKFYCSECGQILKREERIYCNVGSNWEVIDYPLWDIYICINCGYFSWDKDSRRSSKLTWITNVSRDPRYHGTMDGHPRFDKDHKKYQERQILEEDEKNECRN